MFNITIKRRNLARRGRFIEKVFSRGGIFGRGGVAGRILIGERIFMAGPLLAEVEMNVWEVKSGEFLYLRCYDEWYIFQLIFHRQIVIDEDKF